tara:strand:+ start:230 stop:607 length:378 start_codon:yes stop_codon:yes gene_type:complete
MFNFTFIDLSFYRKFVLELMRLVLIAIFLKAGFNKLPIIDGQGLTKALPLFLVYLVVIFEIVGPIFLALGVKFKKLQLLGSLMIAIVMLGATYMKFFVWDYALLSKDVMYPFTLFLICSIFITEE